MRLMVWMLVVCAGLAQANAVAEESGANKTGMEATYTGGTVPGIQPGTDGKLDATSPTALEFHANGGVFFIPYAGITAARYKEENRFRLGVLATIGVGLLKARSKVHLTTITWKDEHAVVQAAIFENSRQRSLALLTILRVRAPQVCSTKVECIGTMPN